MSELTLDNRNFSLFLEEKTIKAAVTRVAKEITGELQHEKPLFVCVLNGAFMYAADLVKHFSFDCEISFIKITSYEDTASTGKVREIIGLIEDIKDRTVVIVEDIVDSGVTLDYLYKRLLEKNPKSLKVTTLLFKPDAYKKDIRIDYAGIEVPQEFVVGYGLDYNGYGRNLKDIYTIAKNTKA